MFLKKIIIGYLLILSAFCLPFNVEAKKKVEIDIFELSIDENIATPLLGKQYLKIRECQSILKNNLNELKLKGYPYQVELIRDGEVIMVTIGAKHLFKANDTLLSENGKNKIEPLLNLLKKDGMYKMVLAMHSDNTGNDYYCMNLTTKRVNSIYDWIVSNKNLKSDRVVPYALGNSEPIVDNNSIANRDKNRRLVVYLIPDQGMINETKKGEW